MNEAKAAQIERFTTISYPEYTDNDMRPIFDGEWVRYSDHKAALATARKEGRAEAFNDVRTFAQSKLKQGPAKDAMDVGWNLALAEIINCT